MNVFFHTFGCRANQYDTARVRQAFADQGAVVVAPDHADLAVVNSCTVTGESEGKLRPYIRGLARRRPALETVVMSCAAAARLRDPGLPAVRQACAVDLRAWGEARALADRAHRRGATADGVASGHSRGRLEVMTEDYLSVEVPTDAWHGRGRFPVTVV